MDNATQRRSARLRGSSNLSKELRHARHVGHINLHHGDRHPRRAQFIQHRLLLGDFDAAAPGQDQVARPLFHQPISIL